MAQLKISCVVPTLNSAATLNQTLLSLRAQQDVDVEILVVDSGSIDQTLAVCQHWDVPTLYAPPGNMYHAINTGLQQCRSGWLAYLNSDDWVYHDSFARLITHGEAAGAGVVYGNCDYTDGQGRFVYSFAAARPHQLLSLFRLGVMGFAQQAAIFRREVYEELQGFDKTFQLRADADFYLRALRGGSKFTDLDGPPVACFRLHEKQLSNQPIEITNVEAKRIFEAPGIVAGLDDRLTFANWRLRNAPHYLIRILRESLLSQKIRFPRTIEPYTHR